MADKIAERYSSSIWNVKLSAEGDGSKIYVSCVAFRDPVCEDIAEAYRIPANSFADKCICLVSRLPSFHLLRNVLEELFSLCFSPDGSRYVSFSAKVVIVCFRQQLRGNLDVLCMFHLEHEICGILL